MATRAHGIPPEELSDDDLRRAVRHLHDTRHDVLTGGSESALRTHTDRQLALEYEFLRRFPEFAAPDPARTRAGSRAGTAAPIAASRLVAVVVACHDADALADFWAAALPSRTVCRWTDPKGTTYVQLNDEHGTSLLFQPVADLPADRSRLHLDVRPVPARTRDEEVTRLLDLGATLRSDDPDLPWVVLADPEGNEFCVLPCVGGS